MQRYQPYYVRHQVKPKAHHFVVYFRNVRVNYTWNGQELEVASHWWGVNPTAAQPQDTVPETLLSVREQIKQHVLASQPDLKPENISDIVYQGHYSQIVMSKIILLDRQESADGKIWDDVSDFAVRLRYLTDGAYGTYQLDGYSSGLTQASAVLPPVEVLNYYTTMDRERLLGVYPIPPGVTGEEYNQRMSTMYDICNSVHDDQVDPDLITALQQEIIPIDEFNAAHGLSAETPLLIFTGDADPEDLII